MNDSLVAYLEEIASYYKILGRPNDEYRYESTMRAAREIKKLKYKLLTKKQALKLPGIGESISKTVEEYATFGSEGKLDELKKLAGNSTKYIKLFMGIYGVGLAKAKELYEEGYREIEDIPLDALTPTQQLGVKYYKEINTRFTLKEAQDVFEEVKEVLEDYVSEITLVGSCRRLKKTIGDIDILVTPSKKSVTLNLLIEKLKENSIIKEVLGYDLTKFSGITSKPYKRIDIRLVKQDEYPCALLYFTGSKEFNIYLRKRALERYMKLNEYHLIFDYDGTFADVDDERDIFAALDMKYVKPEDRVEDYGQ